MVAALMFGDELKMLRLGMERRGEKGSIAITAAWSLLGGWDFFIWGLGSQGGGYYLEVDEITG